MTDDERARFLDLVAAIDEAVAARPDILASPVGFVVGAIVSAANADAEGSWRQLSGLGDVLSYLAHYVRTGEGDPHAVVLAFVPAA